MKIKNTMLALMGAVMVMLMLPAQAASQDECAIWICAPGGFPAGCGAAHAAMIERVKDFKSPIPSFSSCAVTPPGGSDMDAKHGYVAYVPERRVCDKWDYYSKHTSCESYKTIEAHYVHDTTCKNDPITGEKEPAGCSRTGRYIEVYADGELAGPTYYW